VGHAQGPGIGHHCPSGMAGNPEQISGCFRTIAMRLLDCWRNVREERVNHDRRGRRGGRRGGRRCGGGGDEDVENGQRGRNLFSKFQGTV
jgi:hypothetical protein